MKLAYIYSTFATKGGTERIIVDKANYFSEHFGYDVTIITCFQKVDEPNFFQISPKVKQIYLEIPYYSQYKYKYPKRLWVRWQINKLLKKSINQTVNQIDPDFLICPSRFIANYISTIKCRAKKIIECHVIRQNTINKHEGNPPFPIRVYMAIYSFIYLRTMERNADALVTLTEEDNSLYKQAKHKYVIPNFSTMQINHYSDCTAKRVIAVGRLEWTKGFGRLIEIWTIVSSKYPDWQLDIYGEGELYESLMTLIKVYKTKNITIHNCTSNISMEYAKSSICAVTSYYEGFSLVTLEAMRHGVPCVAFDCPYGPKSIINDAQCGFLVDNGDIRLYAERLCRLIQDKELRTLFSEAAKEKAKTFDVDIITNKWRSFFEEMICS